jgi:hypothetical protein
MPKTRGRKIQVSKYRQIEGFRYQNIDRSKDAGFKYIGGWNGSDVKISTDAKNKMSINRQKKGSMFQNINRWKNPGLRSFIKVIKIIRDYDF